MALFGPINDIQCLKHSLLMIQMIQNMKGQFAQHLMHAGFVSSPDPKDPKSNANSGEPELLFSSSFFSNKLLMECLPSPPDNEKLIKATIVAGLYPKVAAIRQSFSKKRPG